MRSTEPSHDEVRTVCARLLPEFNLKVVDAVARRQSVYRIESAAGERLALKLFADSGERGSDPESLATETASLTELYRLGCPVPRLVAAERELSALAMEWIDGETLELRLQRSPLVEAESTAVLRSLAAMETAYQGLTVRHDPALAAAAHRELIARTRHELAALADSPLADIVSADRDRWAEIFETAATAVTAGPWSYGSLDCSASNLLLAEGGAFVLDLSILGAEWRERRTVRYAVATGIGRSDGGYASLFNQETAAQYATLVAGEESAAVIAGRLDLNHVLVLLGALARSTDSPDAPASRRRRQSLLNLARRPLTPGGIAGALRNLIPADVLEWDNS